MRPVALRQRLGAFVRASPRLERWWSRATAGPHLEHFASSRSRLVVEGFPRSGNTFLCALLFAAGLAEEDLAHHFHSLGHVKTGLDLGLDVVVVVRSPVDAVASLTVRDPATDPVESLREYARFHRGLVDLRRRAIHCLAFESLVAQPVEVVHATFGLLGATPRPGLDRHALTEQARQRVERWHRAGTDGTVESSAIALPGFAEDSKRAARARVGELVARTAAGRSAVDQYEAALRSLPSLVVEE